eukprot:364902-Chlamydomonas_euryale.AAC.19
MYLLGHTRPACTQSESELQEADPHRVWAHRVAQQDGGDQTACWVPSQTERPCTRSRATAYQPRPANRGERFGRRAATAYPATAYTAIKSLATHGHLIQLIIAVHRALPYVNQ